MKIVHGANAQNALIGESRADAVQKRTARGTEIVGHVVARGDTARLAEGFQIVAAADVLEVRVRDGKVGCEHGRGDFAAVGAIADEGVDQAWALGWLGVWVRYQSSRDRYGDGPKGKGEPVGVSHAHR